MTNPYLPKLGPAAKTALPGLPRRKSTVKTVSNAFNWQPTLALTGGSFALGSSTAVGSFTSIDGLNLYVIDATGDLIRHYAFATAWDESTLSVVGTFAVGSEDTSPTCGFISDDGTKIYVGGNLNDRIFQYTLPTPFSLVGMSYSGLSKLVSSETAAIASIFMSRGGGRLYTAGTTNIVYQYSVSDTDDISTASVVGNSGSLGYTGAQDIFLSPEEDKLYFSDLDKGIIHQVDLPTPKDITVFVDNSAAWAAATVSGTEAVNAGISFSQDGKNLIFGTNSNKVWGVELAEVFF